MEEGKKKLKKNKKQQSSVTKFAAKMRHVDQNSTKIFFRLSIKIFRADLKTTLLTLSFLRSFVSKIGQFKFALRKGFSSQNFVRVANNKQNFKNFLHVCNSQ